MPQGVTSRFICNPPGLVDVFDVFLESSPSHSNEGKPFFLTILEPVCLQPLTSTTTLTPSPTHLSAGMKPPQERQLILVANAHMHWDPEFSDVKLIQTMMFLSELKSIAERASGSAATGSPAADPSSIPIVLCADLNSLPDSGRKNKLEMCLVLVSVPSVCRFFVSCQEQG